MTENLKLEQRIALKLRTKAESEIFDKLKGNEVYLETDDSSVDRIYGILAENGTNFVRLEKAIELKDTDSIKKIKFKKLKVSKMYSDPRIFLSKNECLEADDVYCKAKYNSLIINKNNISIIYALKDASF